MRYSFEDLSRMSPTLRAQVEAKMTEQGVSLATIAGETVATAKPVPDPFPTCECGYYSPVCTQNTTCKLPPRQIVAPVPDLELVHEDPKRTARRYRQLEHIEQVKVVNRCLAMAAHDARFGCFFAVPNANPSGKALGGYFKGEGVRAGVPDLCFPVPVGKYHGAFIELKVGDRPATDLQNEWQARLIGQGYFVVTAWECDEAWQHICNYMAGRV